MNNTATLVLTLSGMATLDVFLVSQRTTPQPHGLEAVYLAELPAAMQYTPNFVNGSPERAQRLFTMWGEWRPSRVASRHFVIYDTGVDAARVFPTPEWLVSADRSDYLPAPGETAHPAR
jgi:hypothetical protein